MAQVAELTETSSAEQSTCPACVAADTNPYAGQYLGDCLRCAMRYTSQQPRAFREKVFAAITDPQEREQFRLDCIAEYRRREALKVDRPLQ